MRFIAVTALAAAALALPAQAAKIESAYTKFDEKTCKELESNPDEGGSFLMRCPGHSQIPVFVGEGDLRMFVAYGMNAKQEVAYGQTFGYFNSVGPTLEWRLRDGKPFATILRWNVNGGEDLPSGEMLVVTQLDEGNQCWVAVIAAHKNKNANELARKAADDLAGKANCNDENFRAAVIGTPSPDIYE